MQKLILFFRKVFFKLPVILFDVIAIPIAWYTAYWLRYNLHPFPNILITSYSFWALSFLVVVQTACYYYFKTYRGVWRFSSLNDVVRILKASVSATLLVIPVFYLTSILHSLPRSVFPLYCLILTTFLCGGRLMMRLYGDKRSRGVILKKSNVYLLLAQD